MKKPASTELMQADHGLVRSALYISRLFEFVSNARS